MDGTVRCWGNTLTLGIDVVQTTADPARLPELAGVEQIVLGFTEDCALLHGGAVECWNAYSSATPTGAHPDRLLGTRGVVLRAPATSLVVGIDHVCTILVDRSVECWGHNSDGQLGDGTWDNDRDAPAPVVGLQHVAQMAASRGHTCAVREDHTVWCRGANAARQLGDGTTMMRTTPVQVVGIADAVAVAVGQGFTCVARADGRAWCWGANAAGQLGDGTTMDRGTPAPAVGLDGVVGVSASDGEACALRADGEAWCWGNNQSGQLGDGTTTDRPVPGPVHGLGDVVQLAVGRS